MSMSVTQGREITRAPRAVCTGRTLAEGFSLVELLVAMTVAVVVTSTVFALLGPATGAVPVQAEAADVDQRLRAAGDALLRDIGLHQPGVERQVAGAIDEVLREAVRDRAALGDLAGKPPRGLQRRPVGGDRVDDAPGEGGLAADGGAGEQHLLGAGRADETRQPLRSATTGDDAEQDLRLAEDCLRCGDPVVARHRQFAPSTECEAAHGRDGERGNCGERIESSVERGTDDTCLVRTTELRDVGSGSEEPVSTGEHDRPGGHGQRRSR